MPVQQPDSDSDAERDVSPIENTTGRAVSDESLVLRNYDSADAHEIAVRFVDHHGETAFDRTVAVAPLETVSVQTRLERAVYRVEVRLENGTTASAECLIGSDPGECAMVETGNGRISVVEGVF